MISEFPAEMSVWSRKYIQLRILVLKKHENKKQNLEKKPFFMKKTWKITDKKHEKKHVFYRFLAWKKTCFFSVFFSSVFFFKCIPERIWSNEYNQFFLLIAISEILASRSTICCHYRTCLAFWICMVDDNLLSKSNVFK